MNKLALSFPRLGLLLRNDLLAFFRPVLYATAGLFGLMLVLYFVQVQDVVEHGTVPPFFTEWFGTILMVVGFLMSSFAFHELSHKEKGMAFLMVPASQLEKWLSRFLLTSIGFALYFWLTFGLIALISEGLSLMIFDAKLNSFEWAGENTWLLLRMYVVFQSIFMAGSVLLGKLAFLKTPVTLVIVGAALVLVLYITLQLLMWNISKPGWEIEPDGHYRSSAAFGAFMEHTFVDIVTFLYWWVLAPFFWVVSYVGLTEKEV